MRQLEIERFGRLDLTRDELHPAFGHGLQLFRMGILDVVRATVAVGAVVLVEAMPGGADPTDVPFAKVRGRIAGPLEHFREGGFACGQFHRG